MISCFVIQRPLSQLELNDYIILKSISLLALMCFHIMMTKLLMAEKDPNLLLIVHMPPTLHQ